MTQYNVPLWDQSLFQPDVEQHKKWAQEALDKVMNAEPALTFDGFGVYDLAEDNPEKSLAESRERLLSGECNDGIAASAVWIRTQKLVKTINKDMNSYGYKHQVERYFRRSGDSVYVPAGGFIVAALALGIPHVRGERQIHCPFSEKTLYACGVGV